ncbi:TetR/AcrR family transcriptional regulator [Halobacteriovorax sp.]|uniref:TetR/AcrR family transcriptional regulator n=1 Tax=Halobacteriovorax sp. TaxID=2020862 RepID=UPI0035689FBF
MGKKRQFNEEDVLGQLSSHFWKHGFSATKVDQLSEVTGLTKTSLYNAFGNKEALFLSAINFYVEKSLEVMSGYLDVNNKLSTNLEKLLTDTFITADKDSLSCGCFLTNSIVELNANELELHSEVALLCDKVRKVKLNFFSHYVENNKVVEGYSAEGLTNYFMTFFQGLRVQSRNHETSENLMSPITIFLKFIKSIEK